MTAQWPPNYRELFKWRQSKLLHLRDYRRRPRAWAGALEYYRTRPVEWISHWVDTFDPRNAADHEAMVRMPLVMFQRQREMVQMLQLCLEAQAHGLIEKARDTGATWVCCAFSVHLWRFMPGAAVGWGSRKEDLVDTIGDLDSIFEKIRMIIRNLPPEFLPQGFTIDNMHYMKIINPASGASITGESGDNIGRGGRKLIYFKDESAHYERPEIVEAALLSNTNVQIDISSVGAPGNVFHRKREAGIDWHPGKAVVKGKTNVLVVDWRDDPRKGEQWYREIKAYYDDNAMPHVFAREVERNYAASMEGIIILPEWVKAAIDAHLFLELGDDGMWSSGLDVGDSEGGDRNAQIMRKGIVVRFADQWTARDPGVTARRAVVNCMQHPGVVEMQYDCIGVGAAVKAETNRLKFDDPETTKLIKNVHLMPWNAGDSALYPHRRVVENDAKSPLNKDFYQNLKAQAWWELSMRFYRTWKAVEAKRVGDHYEFDPDTLVSIDSRLPLLRLLEKELSQAIMIKSAKLRLLVDKTPKGTKSPNLADAMVMCFWPIPRNALIVASGPKIFVHGEEQHVPARAGGRK